MSRRVLLVCVTISLGVHIALLAFGPAVRKTDRLPSPLPIVLTTPGRAREKPQATRPATPISAPRPRRLTDGTKPGGSPPSGRDAPFSPLPPLPHPSPEFSSPPPPMTPASAPLAFSTSPASLIEASSPESQPLPGSDIAAGAAAGVSEVPSNEQAALPQSPPELTAPLYDINPRPPYPRLAQERGWQGDVVLRVRVSAAGAVLEAKLERSSGHPFLDRAAGEAVRGWRFRPGRLGGKAVESEALVPVRYRLERKGL